MRVVVTCSNGRQATYTTDARREWYILRHEIVYYYAPGDRWKRATLPAAATRTFGACTNGGEQRRMMSISPLPGDIIPGGLRRGYTGQVSMTAVTRADGKTREWEADEPKEDPEAIRAFCKRERETFTATAVGAGVAIKKGRKRGSTVSGAPVAKKRG